jgi:hypothetical protein
MSGAFISLLSGGAPSGGGPGGGPLAGGLGDLLRSFFSFFSFFSLFLVSGGGASLGGAAPGVMDSFLFFFSSFLAFTRALYSFTAFLYFSFATSSCVHISSPPSTTKYSLKVPSSLFRTLVMVAMPK